MARRKGRGGKNEDAGYRWWIGVIAVPLAASLIAGGSAIWAARSRRNRGRDARCEPVRSRDGKLAQLSGSSTTPPNIGCNSAASGALIVQFG